MHVTWRQCHMTVALTTCMRGRNTPLQRIHVIPTRKRDMNCEHNLLCSYIFIYIAQCHAPFEVLQLHIHVHVVPAGTLQNILLAMHWYMVASGRGKASYVCT